jgi:prepilin-type N-terminal cleavage/methylation domain-containing protein
MKTDPLVLPVRKSSGFTLVELMVVVLVVGLLFSISLTGLDHMIPRYKLRAAQRELGDTIRLAKAHAASLSRDVYVQYDLDRSEYLLLVPVEYEKGEKKQIRYDEVFDRRLPDGVTFKDLIMPLEKDAKVTTGMHRIPFSPFGYSGHHIVNLTGEGENVASLKINGLTGNISYLDQYQDQEELLKDE